MGEFKDGHRVIHEGVDAEVVGIGSFITRVALGTYGREDMCGLGLR